MWKSKRRCTQAKPGNGSGHDAGVDIEQRACSGCAGDYEDPDDGWEEVEESEEVDVDGSS